MIDEIVRRFRLVQLLRHNPVKLLALFMERLTYFKKLIADHKSNMDDDHESMIYHYLEQIRDKTIINDEQLSSQMSGKVAICINYANRPQIINWNLNRLQRISCCFWCLIYSSLAERRPSRP